LDPISEPTAEHAPSTSKDHTDLQEDHAIPEERPTWLRFDRVDSMRVFLINEARDMKVNGLLRFKLSRVVRLGARSANDVASHATPAFASIFTVNPQAVNIAIHK